MGEVMPRPLVTGLVALLFVANTINVGADLAAMGEAAKLVAGFDQHAFTICFALRLAGAAAFHSLSRYARFLTVLTFSLFAYVAMMFLMPLDWKAIGAGLIGLHPNLHRKRRHHHRRDLRHHHQPLSLLLAERPGGGGSRPERGRHPLIDGPREAPSAFTRIRIDTIAGMLVSNLIALAIMIATAATLHADGVTNINTAADAARRWKPIAGRFAFACSASASSAPVCWRFRCWRDRRPMRSAKRAAGRPAWTTCPGRRAASTR